MFLALLAAYFLFSFNSLERAPVEAPRDITGFFVAHLVGKDKNLPGRVNIPLLTIKTSEYWTIIKFNRWGNISATFLER